jgi:hypothetical protein
LAQTSIKRRKILFASIIIAVLVASSIGTVIIYNQLTTTRISLSLSTNQTSILQGSSSQIQVNVESKGNPENTALTANSNSSSIQCSFTPATGKSSFTSTLKINVPDSVPTGNYSLTVKASGSTTMANASCMISVLGKNVTVSGGIQVFSSWAVNIDSLQFKDIRTNAIFTVAYTYGQNGENGYSIVLRNDETYNVTVNFHYGVLDFTPFSASIYLGNLTVYAPAGSNVMQGQDFTLNYAG